MARVADNEGTLKDGTISIRAESVTWCARRRFPHRVRGAAGMLDDVLGTLRCPVCAGTLTRRDQALRCPAGHSYDIGKQGHVTLLAGAAPTGDTAAMVASREAFLRAGHYDWLAEAIADETADVMRHGRMSRGFSECVVDAGAGTGFYLSRVLDRLGSVATGIALDSSGYALRRAARAHPRIGAVGADLWRPLPLVDGAAGLVLNIFAPRNGEEFHRILSPGGRLLTVTPTRRHLAELVEGLGLLSVDEDKERKLADTLGGCFHFQSRARRDHIMTLDHESVAALVGMGPSAWHTDPEALAERIAALPPRVTVTGSCYLTLWRPHQ